MMMTTTLKRAAIAALAACLAVFAASCSDAPELNDTRAGVYIRAFAVETLIQYDTYDEQCAFPPNEFEITVQNFPKNNNANFPGDATPFQDVFIEDLRVEFVRIGGELSPAIPDDPPLGFTAQISQRVEFDSEESFNVSLPLNYTLLPPVRDIFTPCPQGAGFDAPKTYQLLGEVRGETATGERVNTSFDTLVTFADYGD